MIENYTLKKIIVTPPKQLTDPRNENTKIVILKLINIAFSLLKAPDAETMKKVLEKVTFIRENIRKCSNHSCFHYTSSRGIW